MRPQSFFGWGMIVLMIGRGVFEYIPGRTSDGQGSKILP
jgi:hypothetical protein